MNEDQESFQLPSRDAPESAPEPNRYNLLDYFQDTTDTISEIEQGDDKGWILAQKKDAEGRGNSLQKGSALI